MTDPIFSLLTTEEQRQQDTLMLIPSENYASKAVMQAVGSVFGNKYAEGYPNKRYYEGNEIADEIEQLAIDRAKKLFNVPHVNAQPYSGSPANSAILFALADPGDTIMGLSLSSGGHLTHGHPNVTFSGKYYKSIQFGLGKNGKIDYDDMRARAIEHKPKVIILGTTAYPYVLDWKKARSIADEVDAYLVADVSHIVGLILADVHPSPVPYAHVVMTTTHKTLRGPRGALILVTDEGVKKEATLPRKIDAAVFPGLQGGPHLNAIAGIAVALGEAETSAFIACSKQIVTNAVVLADALQENGISLVGGGTQNHLMIMDFSQDSVGKGTLVARAMAVAGIVANKNTVPGDPSPFYPSGVRLGTPAMTTRGMKEKEMKQIAEWISRVVQHIQDEHLPKGKEARQAFLLDFNTRILKDTTLLAIAKEVKQLCATFPCP